jgi:hypothetical protein
MDKFLFLLSKITARLISQVMFLGLLQALLLVIVPLFFLRFPVLSSMIEHNF